MCCLSLKPLTNNIVGLFLVMKGFPFTRDFVKQVLVVLLKKKHQTESVCVWRVGACFGAICDQNLDPC